MADRFKAAALHAVLSLSLGSLVLLLVFGFWYPAPLDTVSGVGRVLILVLTVDIVLGPLLTLAVFDRRKKSLRLDLTIIAILQLTALGYGLLAVEAGRPLYLVFVKDRFEVVARADLDQDGNAHLKALDALAPSWIGPTLVAATQPVSLAERERILFESVTGGKDLHHYPKLYRAFDSQQDAARSVALDLDLLRKLNQDRHDAIQRSVVRAGLPASKVAYLPVKGQKSDAAMLIERDSGKPLGLIDATPWK